MNTLSNQNDGLPAKTVIYGQTLHMGTLLLVEDSRLASDAVRLLFRGAGGRMRRTDTVAGALRHLDLYTPDAALVDLGLPDGSGLDLIAFMAKRRPRVPLIVATSGMTHMGDAALDAGADDFLPKPITNMAVFRQALGCVFHTLRHSDDTPFAAPPDTAALRDDMYLAHDLLCGARSSTQRAYALQFTATIAQVLGDHALAEGVQSARVTGATTLLAARIGTYLQAQPLV